MRKLTEVVLSGVLAFGGVSAINCTPAFVSEEQGIELNRQVKNQHLIIGFEGMQPWSGYRAKNLVDEVANSLGFAHVTTSGNPEVHIKTAEEAHRNNKIVYILGYSSGANDALQLALYCKKRNIPVEALIHTDPTYLARPFPRKTPSNIRKWIVYRSNHPELFKGREPIGENIENPDKTQMIIRECPKVDHFEIMNYVTEMIKKEIGSNP